MTARVAVATARFGDPWDELAVLASRLAGALACTADVDVLVPVSAPRRLSSDVEVGWHGACRLLQFPATSADRRVRAAWRALAFGAAVEDGAGTCACPAGRAVPALVEEQLVLAEGGDAPGLYEHLRTNSYDAVVFVGLHTPVTCFGVRALTERQRFFLVPGQSDIAITLTVHEVALARAEGILVCTAGEQRRIADRVGTEGTGRVEDIGFLLGVNPVVRPKTPAGDGPFVVVAGDWRTARQLRRYGPWAARLAGRLPHDVALRLVGPGADVLPHGVPRTEGRIDAWWWMSRSLATIDPVPRRVLGQEVLEAMLLGVPVVVAANGDASREHAEVGNGGLWFRTDDELVASVRRLLQPGLAASLGEHGRSYAVGRFADTDTYVKRVSEAVLG